MIALCLLIVAVHAEAEAEAEAEADPYYGYYGRGHGYGGGYGNYYRRSARYGYAPTVRSYTAYRPATYHHRTYAAPAPVRHAAPAPLHAAPVHAPAPAHIEYRHEEPAQYVSAIKAFPAVPEEHAVYEAAEQPIAVTYHEEQPAIEVSAPAAPAQVQLHAVPAQVPIAPAPISTQYHAQDELGNVIYGYENINSAKQEQRDAYGNVIGSYSYNDATGYPKYVSYVADDFGFRVTSANNLPVAPSAY